MQSGSPYRQFALDFVWSGSELKTYRMRLLPKYMARSEQRAFWMQQLRQDCDAMIDPETQLDTMLKEMEQQELSDDPDVLYEQLQRQRDLEMLKNVPMAPLKIAAYTYMMVFYESDLGILSSVLINMLSAGVAMLLVRGSQLSTNKNNTARAVFLCAVCAGPLQLNQASAAEARRAFKMQRQPQVADNLSHICVIGA